MAAEIVDIDAFLAAKRSAPGSAEVEFTLGERTFRAHTKISALAADIVAAGDEDARSIAAYLSQFIHKDDREDFLTLLVDDSRFDFETLQSLKELFSKGQFGRPPTPAES
jgi:hypothetical protein